MLKVDTENVTQIYSSDWLYGFILRYLKARGEIRKHDLMARVQLDVKHTFPNLADDYFYRKFENSDNVFMTLFYFAIFHLREKGYGLIKQRILKNEPVISLSPIGHEFLQTSEGRSIFVDYRNIEMFLRKNYPRIHEKSFKQVEHYRKEIQKLQEKSEDSRQNGKIARKSLPSLHPVDITLTAIVLVLFIVVFLFL